MSNTKAVSKDYLLTQLKNFDNVILKNKYLSNTQDVADANKILGIGEDGKVVPVEAPSSVKVSAETDNQIEEKQDGIYVKDMSAKISSEEGNAITEKADGLYVPTTTETKVSQAEGNTIEVKDDGIYVAPTDLTNYVEKLDGKGLSTNDLTDELKEKYNKAEENVQSDWNETDETSDAFIKNKPTIPSTDGLATETFVADKIAEAQLGGEEVDLSAYIKETDADEKYVLDEEIEVLDVAAIESMIGLSTEELEGLSQIIDDSSVRIDKTNSSSFIYQSIQDAITTGKEFTLSEIAKASTASYKVVSDTSNVTEEKYIYLIANVSNSYDMYVLDDTGAVQIGTTEINLDVYLTTETANQTYVLQAVFDLLSGNIGDVANLTTTDKTVVGAINELKTAVDNATVEVSETENNQIQTLEDGLFVDKPFRELDSQTYESLTDEERNNGTIYFVPDTESSSDLNIEIVTELNELSTDDTVPSAKSVYDALQLSKGEKGEDGRSITSITKDDNDNIIVTFSDNTTQNIGKLSVDIQGDFLTTDGFGNLRYYNGKFQYYDTNSSTWVDTSVSPENVYILQMVPQTMKFIGGVYDIELGFNKLKWEEPSDTVIDGQVGVVVEKVVVRRKLGSVPTNENDGDLVIDVKRKDFGSYKNTWYVDETLTPANGEVWYYKAFPISSNGFANTSSANECEIICKDYWLFGFKLDQNESEPASMIEYIEDNKNYHSAYMNYSTDMFDYGDWKDVWFIRDLKPCMLNYDGTVAYELDKNDYSLKADGTPSDIANDSFGGNAMVGIPKIYWKIVDNGDDTANIYFSNKKLDDDFVCWSHIDNNGNEIDYCYMPIYNGSNVSSKLRSLSGKTPISSQTGTTEITYAKANNLTSDIIWYTEVFSDRQLVNLLLLLIGKSTDTQTVFGNGHYTGGSSASALLTTGTLNNKGLFYGTNDTGKGVKVFGMENWWGNQWRRIAGWINNKGMQKIKLTYGQSDGSTVDGYNTDGSGYIDIGCTPNGTNGGYVRKMTFNKNGLIPIVASGSATTYYTDGLWFNNSQVNYALVGGAPNNWLLTGALYSDLQDTASVTDLYVSASVSCKPLATT